MSEITGRLRPVGRVAIIVSRYNETVTGRLLQGALACCTEAGIERDSVDVVWVPGAYELPVAVAHRLPVGFGLLTTDTLEQAAARAGGAAGNKGHEAAAAAIQAADAIAQLRARHAQA